MGIRPAFWRNAATTKSLIQNRVEYSAQPSLDFGVEVFEFDAGVFELEAPVDAALFGVGFF